MDDSGSRRPNHKPEAFRPGQCQHFALGGVLLKEEDRPAIREAHATFCAKWNINYPLRSFDIRRKTKKFKWLNDSDSVNEAFLVDLEEFLLALPVLGIACVIDRPGYDARYRLKYGRQQWHLCQTAFCIVVERACKHALRADRKLRIFPERSTAEEEDRLTDYFHMLRDTGMPFDARRSGRYRPTGAEQFSDLLYEIRHKHKGSAAMQVADLYLWPMAQHGYYPFNAPYQKLRDAGKLIECGLSRRECEVLGSKYSCFELVSAARKRQRLSRFLLSLCAAFKSRRPRGPSPQLM
jgi:hypothetical protein